MRAAELLLAELFAILISHLQYDVLNLCPSGNISWGFALFFLFQFCCRQFTLQLPSINLKVFLHRGIN